MNKASSGLSLYYVTLNVKKDTAGDDVELSQTVYKVADGFKRLMDNTRTNGTNPDPKFRIPGSIPTMIIIH